MWISDRIVVARCIVDPGAAKRFAISRSLVQPASARVHASHRFGHGGVVWLVAGVAKLARRCATGVERGVAGKWRRTIGETNARWPGHWTDRAHPHVACRGGAGVEEFFAIAIALVRLRTARIAHGTFRIAVANLQHQGQDRHLYQERARQSAPVTRRARRRGQLESAADGWMANRFLARRNAATDCRANVER